MEEIKSFSKEVKEQLNHYVYELIDPRNGQIFYIGQGCGDRVFQHAKAEINADDDEDNLSLKLSTIRDIRNSGLEVIQLIVRHGMTQNTAFEVEAALIDTTPGLTNIQDGHGNIEYGIASVKEIIDKYTTKPVEFAEKIILIKIKSSRLQECDGDVYEAGRKWWRASLRRAQKADYVVISIQGIIRDVYSVDVSSWEKNETNGRIGFKGVEAPKEIRDKYLNKRIPEDKMKTQNPFSYSNI